MTTRDVTNGPTADAIFTAARYATNRKWRTPLEFTVSGLHIIEINWINGPTWLGEHSRLLTFTVKYGGETLQVYDYDTVGRCGSIAIKNPGLRGIQDIVELIEKERQDVLDRVQRAL